jgi:hypothetical protein
MQVSPRILPGLALASLLAGCEGKHLEGSITPLLDLHYDEAQVAVDTSEASVRFITQQGSGENTVLKVAASLEKIEVTTGVEINLAERMGEAETSPQRGSISRSVLDEPARPFPRMLRGGLTFTTLPLPCSDVSGEFHVTFDNGIVVYSGRTVFGKFDATVPSENCP